VRRRDCSGTRRDASFGGNHHAPPNALEMLANVVEGVDPLLHNTGPTFDVDDDTGPIIDFGAQHPDHEAEPGPHGIGENDVLDDISDTTVAGNNNGTFGDVIIMDVPNDVLLAVAGKQDTHDQVSDNELAGGGIPFDTVDHMAIGPVEYSSSADDIPWDEESQESSMYSAIFRGASVQCNDTGNDDVVASADNNGMGNNDVIAPDLPLLPSQ